MKRVVCLLAIVLPVGAQQQQPNKVEQFEIKVAPPGGAAPANDVIMFRHAVPAMPMLSADTVGFVSTEMLGPQTVKRAPYAAEIVTESIQVLGDGNRIIHKSSQAVYRDAEGRSRREMNVEIPGQPADDQKVIFIEDPVAGVHYVLNSKEKTARKMPLPKWDGVGPMPAPIPIAGNRVSAGVVRGGVMAGVAAAPNVVTAYSRTSAMQAPVTEDLGIQNIEGVAAKGTKSTITIAAGEIGNERALVTTTENWFSDELKISVLSKRTDPRFGDSSTKATSIRRGDQPLYLFEVPSDYKLLEMPPPRFELKSDGKGPADLL
jgi:hypothetical protein